MTFVRVTILMTLVRNDSDSYRTSNRRGEVRKVVDALNDRGKYVDRRHHFSISHWFLIRISENGAFFITTVSGGKNDFFANLTGRESRWAPVNGAVGEEQLNWLRHVLETCHHRNTNVSHGDIDVMILVL